MSASRLNPVVPISYPFGCDWNEYFRRFFDEPSSEKVGQLEGIMRHLSVNGLGSAPCPCSLARPSCLLSRQLSSSMSSPAATNVQSDNKLFQVMVDVKQFAPEEIEVKTVDNFIVVQGKHDDKVDEHGLISRQFTRRYTVPDDYDPLFVTSTLSEDGILTIKVPKKVVPGSPSERVVPITLQPGRALSGIHEPTSTISNEEEVIDKQGEDEQHSSITHETV